MPSQLTFTGKIGAAVQLTTHVFPDVRRLAFDFDLRTAQVNYYRGSEPEEAIVDISGGTVTLTDSVTANQHTLVMSVT